MAFLEHTCEDCGYTWGSNKTELCPSCGSDNVYTVSDEDTIREPKETEEW